MENPVDVNGGNPRTGGVELSAAREVDVDPRVAQRVRYGAPLHGDVAVGRYAAIVAGVRCALRTRDRASRLVRVVAGRIPGVQIYAASITGGAACKQAPGHRRRDGGR